MRFDDKELSLAESTGNRISDGEVERAKTVKRKRGGRKKKRLHAITWVG
jgi:hypothetical protein